MKLKFILFQLLLFNFSISLIAGIPPYKLYNYKDGYQGSNPISLYQDKEGFVWISSLNGLIRFDGSYFETYNTSGGLISNEVVGMAEQQDSTLLISFRNKGIMQLKNSKFTNLYLNDKPNFFGNIIITGDAIYTYSQNFIHIIRNNETKQLSNAFTHLTIDSSSFRSGFLLYQILKYNDNQLLAATINGLYIIEGDSVKKVDTQTGTELFSCLYIDKSGNIWAGSKGKIILFDKNLTIIDKIKVEGFENEIVTNILNDDYGNLWYSVSNSGLFRKTRSKTENISRRLGMEKVQINFIKQSSENNVWVGMYGKGLVCFYNIFIENFTSNDGLSNDFITSLNLVNNNKLLIGTINNLNVMDSGGIKQIPIYSYNTITYIKNIEVKGNDVFICGSGLGKQYINNKAGYIKAHDFSIEKYKSGDISFNSFIGSCITLLNDSSLLVGMWNEFVPFFKIKNRILENKGRIILDSDDSLKSIRTDKIFIDKKNQYWIGTTKGLFLVDKDMKVMKLPDNKVMKSAINEIIEDNKGNLWICSKNGLIFLNIFNNEFRFFPFEVENKSLNDFTFDKSQSKIWLGSNEGIYRVNITMDFLSNDNIFAGNLPLLTEANGVISNEINCLLYDTINQVLWAGTNGGLTRIDIDKFNSFSNQRPKLFVKKILLHDSVITATNNLCLTHNNNDITINFSAISHSGIKDLSYRYRFKDEPEWKSLKEPILQLASLSPGDYELQLSCKSNLSDWSKPILLNFSVTRPYWKTSAFYITIAIIFILAVFVMWHVLTTKAVRRQAEKAYLINQLSELKHQALSAMLNPHFIFNAMNSIQSIIASGVNKELANEYLSLFARLIRTNLDLAQNTFITIEDEIERLRMYLELEKMRFGDRLNYNIVIGSEIEKSAYKIPNMIMQPFVENSIWHGLQKSIRDGVIDIKLSKEDIHYEGDIIKVMIITISDNGIGINQELKNKNPNHKSKGISLIEERLNFLETEYTNLRHITIKEKENERGTMVTIILTPGLYIYNDNKNLI